MIDVTAELTKKSLKRIRLFVCENNVAGEIMTYCKYGCWTGLSEIGWVEGVCPICQAIDQEFEWLKKPEVGK